MKTYSIIVYNDSNVKVDKKIFQAANENDAIIKYLKTIILYSGDTIKIEEME